MVLTTLIEGKTKLMADMAEALKKSVYSYIPCTVNQYPKLGDLPLELYDKILNSVKREYDVFYADIHVGVSYDFLLLKGNRVVLFRPYLLLPGQPDKKYTVLEWRNKKMETLNRLLKEPDPKIAVQLAVRLRQLTEPTWMLEKYENFIQPEVTTSIANVLKEFKKLQNDKTLIDGADIASFYAYFGDPCLDSLGHYIYYGLHSHIFGVSLPSFSVNPGTPLGDVSSLEVDLVSYAQNEIVEEGKPETYFYVGSMEDYPFARQHWLGPQEEPNP